MSILIVIIVIFFCIFFEGFFSGSELAIVVSDKLRIKNRAKNGDAHCQMTVDLIKNPRRLFSTTLLGTNVCVVTASTVLTFYIIQRYGQEYSAFALLLSPIVLIFGEVLPKSVYQHHADYLATKVGPILWWLSYAFFPAVWFLSRLTALLMGGVKKVSGLEPKLSREELALILASKETVSSDMSAEERKMIKRVFDLADAEVKNIMIPLVEVEMLPVSADIDAAENIFDLKGYSRLPIFEHRSTNIIGIIDSGDCIFADKTKRISDIMKGVIYVPENMPLYELYESLQEEKEELAVVVDEFGGAVGLVTLEDLLEEFIGDIRDEYELAKQHCHKIQEGRYLVSGRMEVEEANSVIGLNIPDGDYETVAGFILEKFGYIPVIGERVEFEGWEYIVKNATPRAILEIEVSKK